MDFPLQSLVEAAGCKYFAENDTGDGEVLNLALRSPFIRLYALNRHAAVVEAQRRRFADNERIQLFAWTHVGCWGEVVKLVPVDAAAVFWMHATENVSRALVLVSRLRPGRRDVLILEPGVFRGISFAAEQHFGRTHNITEIDKHLIMSPVQ